MGYRTEEIIEPREIAIPTCEACLEAFGIDADLRAPRDLFAGRKICVFSRRSPEALGEKYGTPRRIPRPRPAPRDPVRGCNRRRIRDRQRRRSSAARSSARRRADRLLRCDRRLGGDKAVSELDEFRSWIEARGEHLAGRQEELAEAILGLVDRESGSTFGRGSGKTWIFERLELFLTERADLASPRPIRR